MAIPHGTTSSDRKPLPKAPQAKNPKGLQALRERTEREIERLEQEIRELEPKTVEVDTTNLDPRERGKLTPQAQANMSLLQEKYRQLQEARNTLAQIEFEEARLGTSSKTPVNVDPSRREFMVYNPATGEFELQPNLAYDPGYMSESMRIAVMDAIDRQADRAWQQYVDRLKLDLEQRNLVERQAEAQAQRAYQEILATQNAQKLIADRMLTLMEFQAGPNFAANLAKVLNSVGKYDEQAGFSADDFMVPLPDLEGAARRAAEETSAQFQRLAGPMPDVAGQPLPPPPPETATAPALPAEQGALAGPGFTVPPFDPNDPTKQQIGLPGGS